MNDYSRLVKYFEEADRILIFTHTNMDGDAAGSSIALCRTLRAMGKGAFIMIQDEFPSGLAFLTEDLGGMPYFLSESPYIPDLSIALDMSQEHRLEKFHDLYYSAQHCICIDHHPTESPMGGGGILDPSASATALLVFEALTHGGIHFDKKSAECLYVGMLTDTGSFRYPNCDKRTIEAVAALYDYGIDHARICKLIYENYSLAQLRLENLALDRAEFFCDGTGVISWCLHEDLERLGASEEMDDSCIDRIRSIRGVELVAFIKQRSEGLYKVSFRAKSHGNVNRIASYFGGGGHVRAAGCTIEGRLEEVKAQIKEAMEAELKIFHGRNNRNK